MAYIVTSCCLTKLKGGLLQLHSTEKDAQSPFGT